MNQEDIDKAYVSPIDRFLFEFDAAHSKTPSQLKEINKYKRLYMLRDDVNREQVVHDLWDEMMKKTGDAS